MGGQACVLYGAAEFSRDIDLLVTAGSENFVLLLRAMDSLEAEAIAMPPIDSSYLDRGHAIHFRCRRSDVAGLRIDLMSRLRGVDSFETLWSRRTTIILDDSEIDILAVQDLVRAKKTQRDKDWPMIRRLLEQTFFSLPSPPSAEQVNFLLRELRTPELLVAFSRQHPESAAALASARPALERAMEGDLSEVSAALVLEEADERRNDRIYWEPLKREIEQLRLSRGTFSDR